MSQCFLFPRYLSIPQFSPILPFLEGFLCPQPLYQEGHTQSHVLPKEATGFMGTAVICHCPRFKHLFNGDSMLRLIRRSVFFPIAYPQTNCRNFGSFFSRAASFQRLLHNTDSKACSAAHLISSGQFPEFRPADPGSISKGPVSPVFSKPLYGGRYFFWTFASIRRRRLHIWHIAIAGPLRFF